MPRVMRKADGHRLHQTFEKTYANANERLDRPEIAQVITFTGSTWTQLSGKVKRRCVGFHVSLDYCLVQALTIATAMVTAEHVHPYHQSL